MRRREIITLIGGAAATWPFAARAQQGDRMRLIGVLMAQAEDDPLAQASIKAFQDGLSKLGWTEGRTVRINYRWAGSDPDRMRTYAADLVRMAPDLIVAHTPPGLAAVQRETRTIPIVFVQIVDSKAKSLATCRCKHRPNSSLLSISRLPGRSALRCHRSCSPAPTK